MAFTPGVTMPPSIRAHYETLGAERFYREHGGAYRNPHESRIAQTFAQAVQQWQPDLSAVLDLACGGGEAAAALQACGAAPVTGCDPFTGAAWQQRMGRGCLPFDFAAIAQGALADRRFSLVVCSFALHLCPASRLPGVLWAVAQVTERLWVVTPHKRPHLHDQWGFHLVAEILSERVRIRDYHRNRDR